MYSMKGPTVGDSLKHERLKKWKPLAGTYRRTANRMLPSPVLRRAVRRSRFVWAQPLAGAYGYYPRDVRGNRWDRFSKMRSRIHAGGFAARR